MWFGVSFYSFSYLFNLFRDQIVKHGQCKRKDNIRNQFLSGKKGVSNIAPGTQKRNRFPNDMQRKYP